MGRIRRFTCPACGGSWEARLGQGIMHATPDHVVRAFPADMRQRLLADMGTGGDFDFQLRAAACPRCKGVVSVPALTLPGTGARHTGCCPGCGGAVLLPKEEGSLPCPRCGGGPLETVTVGRWD